jgi:hypothetical protein
VVVGGGLGEDGGGVSCGERDGICDGCGDVDGRSEEEVGRNVSG